MHLLVTGFFAFGSSMASGYSGCKGLGDMRARHPRGQRVGMFHNNAKPWLLRWQCFCWLRADKRGYRNRMAVRSERKAIGGG